MDHFCYRDGTLCAEDVALDDIAAAVGTPFYCYSTATLLRHYQVFADALANLDATICFAVKTNSNIAVLRTLARQGAGADVVSVGEMRRARLAGIPSDKIVFSGVGKTADEIAEALDVGVRQINVESEPELVMVDRVAQAKGRRAPIAFRVNPDVAAGGHHKISTGKREDKFGIEWTQVHGLYRQAAERDGVTPLGLAVHIGSQITELTPFRQAFLRLRDLVALLRADGLEVNSLDLGGGLGIPYGDHGDDEPLPLPTAYAEVVRETVSGLGCSLLFEPGRLISGNAGVLVSRVIHVKEGSTRTFVIVDAGMNDLMRPSLYDSFHHIVPVAEPAPDAARRPMDVVGPICETTDCFTRQRPLPPLSSGDLLALRTAGAYGAVMASSYNTRALVPEVMVTGGSFAVIRPRVEVDDLIALDRLPEWLA